MFMLPIGVGLAAAAYSVYNNGQNQTTEASTGTKQVEINFELREGEMGLLTVGEGKDDKVLVARYQGKLYSTGAFCSHFGVQLNWGVLLDDKVLCPAHAAGFSVITG